MLDPAPHRPPGLGSVAGEPLARADRKASTVKIVSWNLLRRTGAAVTDLVALIEQEQPDLLLMQEATRGIAALRERVGGVYAWAQLPDRIHGLAMWAPKPWDSPPLVVPLPSGAMFHRVSQVLDLGDFTVANVHLSHGQMLNRRQLRRVMGALSERAAVLGDYNIVGPALMPGFHDVGPRSPTHAMGRMVPLRLDRCLARGLVCERHAVLPRGPSDHRPIVVHLRPAPESPARAVRGMAAAVARLRRAGVRAGGGRAGRPPSAGSPSSPG